MNILEEQFNTFHQQNPIVYHHFKRFAFEIIRRGWKHYSSDAILHRIRWHINIETVEEGINPDDHTKTLKINNNHTAYYARLFIEDFPEHKELFRLRKLIGEDEE